MRFQGSSGAAFRGLPVECVQPKVSCIAGRLKGVGEVSTKEVLYSVRFGSKGVSKEEIPLSLFLDRSLA